MAARIPVVRTTFASIVAADAELAITGRVIALIRADELREEREERPLAQAMAADIALAVILAARTSIELTFERAWNTLKLIGSYAMVQPVNDPVTVDIRFGRTSGDTLEALEDDCEIGEVHAATPIYVGITGTTRISRNARRAVALINAFKLRE